MEDLAERDVGSPQSAVSMMDVQAPNTAVSQTSINIFRQFLKRLPDGTLDASMIVSPECYQTWLGVRKTLPQGPEVAFKRALCGHLTSVDGRVPFNQDEEKAILKVLRKKQRWECFKDTEFRFGESGFRAKGFHEKAVTGEALKSNPKKRAKSALQRLSQLGGGLKSSKPESEDEDDDDEDEEESGSGEDVPPQRSSKRQFFMSTSSSGPFNSDVRARQASSRRSTGGASSSATKPKPEGYSCGDEIEDPILFQYPSVDDPTVGVPPPVAVESSFSLSGMARNLFAGMHSTALSFTGLGMGYVGGLMAAARLLLISRGWFVPAPREKVIQVMERLNQQYPGYSITLLNFAETDPTQRIVSQNKASIEYFGRISQEFGGFTGHRFSNEESWRLFGSLAELTSKSSTNPNHEIYTRARFYVKGKVTLCHIWLSIDPVTHLLVERLVPAVEE